MRVEYRDRCILSLEWNTEIEAYRDDSKCNWRARVMEMKVALVVLEPPFSFLPARNSL